MARKTLDTTAIANELQRSAFFPAVEPPASTASAPLVASLPPSPHEQDSQERHGYAGYAQNQQALGSRAASNMRATSITAPEAPTIPAPSPLHTPQHASDANDPVAPHPAHPQLADDAQDVQEPAVRHVSDGRAATLPTQQHASGQASETASDDASMLANRQALIESIRKAVRHVGKEVSFVRLTPDEKRQLTELTYTYKSQGLKTSENEISRIGINWLLEDYRIHGQRSVLANVLAALDA